MVGCRVESTRQRGTFAPAPPLALTPSALPSSALVLRSFFTLLQERKAQLLFPHRLPHSLRKTPGVASRAFTPFSELAHGVGLSALKSALTENLPVSAEINRSCPHVSPMESTLGHPAKDGRPACPEPRREEPHLATKGPSLSPLHSALTDGASRNSFRIRTYEKMRRVGPPAPVAQPLLFTPSFEGSVLLRAAIDPQAESEIGLRPRSHAQSCLYL